MAKDQSAQDKGGNASDLPLLLTAYTTRKRIQRQLGPAFHAKYPPPRPWHKPSPAPVPAPPKPEPPKRRATMAVMQEVDEIYSEYDLMRREKNKRLAAEKEAAKKAAREVLAGLDGAAQAEGDASGDAGSEETSSPASVRMTSVAEVATELLKREAEKTAEGSRRGSTGVIGL